jgi:hypothetical protein
MNEFETLPEPGDVALASLVVPLQGAAGRALGIAGLEINGTWWRTARG